MKKNKILVYVDFMNSAEEIPEYSKYLDKLGIDYDITDDCPDDVQGYTHIFMDYGGLQQPGNSLFVMISRSVEKLIAENPNKYFIIISVMGKDWFENEVRNIDSPNVLFMKNFLVEWELKEILEK